MVDSSWLMVRQLPFHQLLATEQDAPTPIINHQSSIINHQSSIINHQSSIINHQSSM
jgi:hypothetical protein